MSELSSKKLTKISSGEQLMGRLMDAFQNRYDDILDVIDDALDSDVMKERIWAVEQILKRCKLPDEKKSGPATKGKKALNTQFVSSPQKKAEQEIQSMSPEILWKELDLLFKQVQAPNEAKDSKDFTEGHVELKEDLEGTP